jgi:serine/threonine-protein kinase
MQLVVGTITVVESPTVPEGNVIATDPASGQKVVPGSTVNLVLSNGKVLVPDVRNLAVLEARNILTAPTIGYQVSIEVKDAANCTGTPGTVVLDQSITAGPAPQLQTIILYVECVGAPTN